MSIEQKLAILRAVECSPLPITKALARLDMPASTYYRWRPAFRSQGHLGLQDTSPYKGRVWNQLLPAEREKVLEVAMLCPQGRLPLISQMKKDLRYLKLLSTVFSKRPVGSSRELLRRSQPAANITVKHLGQTSNGRQTRHTCMPRTGVGIILSACWTTSAGEYWPGSFSPAWMSRPSAK